MEENRPAMSLRDFLIILFKHRGKVLLTFATIVTTITIVSYTLPPVYEAASTLLVKFGRENIYRSEVGDGSWVSLRQEEMINSEIQVLTSHDLIEKVVGKIGVETLYPEVVKDLPEERKSDRAFIPSVAPKFKGKLTVEGIKKSNAIRVAFQHEDPRISAKAVNQLVDFFKEKHIQVHSDPNSPFLEEQVSTYEEKLSESENNLENFKQKYQVYSLPEQRTLLLQQRKAFDTALKETENTVLDLQKRLDSLRMQMQNVPQDIPLTTVTGQYGIVDNVKNTLLNLQLKEQDLLMKYREDNPLVVSVRKEIMLAKEYLQKQEEDLKKSHTTGKNAVYQDLERETIKTQAELVGQTSRISALRAQVGQLDKEIQVLDLNEKELQQLRREHEVNEKNYRTYLEKVEEARISDDMNRRKMLNVSIIEEAAIPLSPIKPRRSLYIAFSLICGAIAGLGLAFFSEYTTQGLTTPEQVEKRLGLRVLTALPYRPSAQRTELERV